MAVQYLCRVLRKLLSTRGNAEKTRCFDWLRKWSENISQ